MKTPALLLAILLPASAFAQSTAVQQNQQWEAQAEQARQQAAIQQQQQTSDCNTQNALRRQQQDLDALLLSQNRARQEDPGTKTQRVIAAYQATHQDPNSGNLDDRRLMIEAQSAGLTKNLPITVAFPRSLEEMMGIIASVLHASNNPSNGSSTVASRRAILQVVLGYYADYLAVHPDLPTQ